MVNSLLADRHWGPMCSDVWLITVVTLSSADHYANTLPLIKIQRGPKTELEREKEMVESSKGIAFRV